MKPLAGTLGFVMLFFVPAEATWKAVGAWALCVCAGFLLLAYAEAFKRKRIINKKSKV